LRGLIERLVSITLGVILLTSSFPLSEVRASFSLLESNLETRSYAPTYVGEGWWEESFTSSGTWTIPSNVTKIDVLVVAGGGGGGGGSYTKISDQEYRTYRGGGGGGGGLVYVTEYDISGYSSSITVTIGTGGSGGNNTARGTSGSNSVFGSLTAIGGGGGGSGSSRAGISGGSGGGAGLYDRYYYPTGGPWTNAYSYGTGGSSTQTTTNDGYVNTGFGKAGGTSSSSSIAAQRGGGATSAGTGASGGGAGLAVWGTTYSIGGIGQSSTTHGAANTGNGGRGASGSTVTLGGNGGSGKVVIRYYLAPEAGTLDESLVTNSTARLNGKIVEDFGFDCYARFQYRASDSIGSVYPVIEATNTSNTASGTTHTINLPSGISAGDLLLIIFSSDGTAQDHSVSGFSRVAYASYSGHTFSVHSKTATGSEGATVSGTTASTEATAHISYRISGWTDSDISSVVNGISTSPDSPNLAPWASYKTLWISAAGGDYNRTVSTYPSGYSDTEFSRYNSTVGSWVASASKELEAASENPGAYTISASDDWSAVTIAIKGSPIFNSWTISGWQGGSLNTDDTFYLEVSSLTKGTNYEFQAQAAENNSGTQRSTGAWSSSETFTTLSVTFPTVTITAATSLGIESATLNGELTNDGGACIVDVGFVYSTSSQSNPGDTAPEDSDYEYYVSISYETFLSSLMELEDVLDGVSPWLVPDGVYNVDVLVVAGGGGSGKGEAHNERNAGGGGGGGLVFIEDYSLSSYSSSITFSVGSGGAGATSVSSKGSNGGNSSFGNLTAIGGGGGGSSGNVNGSDGGSGGGGGCYASSLGTGGADTQSGQSGDSGIYGFGTDGETAYSDGGYYYPGSGGGATNTSWGKVIWGTEYSRGGYSLAGFYYLNPENSGWGGNSASGSGSDAGDNGISGEDGIIIVRYTPGLGVFSIVVESLESNDTYYVRSYAQNSEGYSYSSSEVSFTVGEATVDPTTYNFGLIATGQYYDTGLNYFTIENDSGKAVDISISGTDFIGGGSPWILSDTGDPGMDIFGLYAGLEGSSYNILVRKSSPYNPLVTNLLPAATQKFGIRFFAPTSFSDGEVKTSTVTLTIVES
jgi:hypothetical protein